MFSPWQEEGERAHHSYIGTEHLLLGFLRRDEGRAARAIKALGVDQGGVRTTTHQVRVVNALVGRVLVISHARDELLGGEHLLLALAEQEGTLARGILDAHGLSTGVIEEELKAAGDGPAEENPANQT